MFRSAIRRNENRTGQGRMKRKHIGGKDFFLQKKEVQKEQQKKKKAFIKEVSTLLLVVFSAAVLGYAFITFVMQTVKVHGPSMEPALENNDTVVLNKLSYVFGSVERGDIVAIRAIGGEGDYDIKRVIAVPGDKVAVVGGRFLVNDSYIDPSYDPGTVISVGRMDQSIVLGENEYFVIGDNLSSSEDSRFSTYGNVNKNEIRGRIVYQLTKGRRGSIERPADSAGQGAEEETTGSEAATETEK